jgi:hypothetical protein
MVVIERRLALVPMFGPRTQPRPEAEAGWGFSLRRQPFYEPPSAA